MDDEIFITVYETDLSLDVNTLDLVQEQSEEVTTSVTEATTLYNIDDIILDSNTQLHAVNNALYFLLFFAVLVCLSRFLNFFFRM